MNTTVIQATTEKTLAGLLSFPQVVGTLLKEGIETYHVDLLRGENRFYHRSGATHVQPVAHENYPIGSTFDCVRVIAAIRGAQAGEIKYPEFLRQIMAAGSVYYIACLDGKKVIYFGRHGDFHVENFPSAK